MDSAHMCALCCLLKLGVTNGPYKVARLVQAAGQPVSFVHGVSFNTVKCDTEPCGASSRA